MKTALIGQWCVTADRVSRYSRAKPAPRVGGAGIHPTWMRIDQSGAYAQLLRFGRDLIHAPSPRPSSTSTPPPSSQRSWVLRSN